jgi:hypothetical protein
MKEDSKIREALGCIRSNHIDQVSTMPLFIQVNNIYTYIEALKFCEFLFLIKKII